MRLLLKLRRVTLIELLHALLELELHGGDGLAVGLIGLALTVVLYLLQLVNRSLELLLGIL